MDWRGALRARALNAAGIASLLPSYTPPGLSATETVFWGERPQGSPLPALTLQVVSDGRPQHLKGFDSLMPGRVQIDAFGKTPGQAWALADAAIAGLVPAETSNGHVFARADVEVPPRDIVERQANETIFRVSMDLLFHHAEEEEAS